jgi:ribosome production factor 1
MSSDSSDNDVAEVPPQEEEKPKRKRLRDYLEEKAERQAKEDAEQEEQDESYKNRIRLPSINPLNFIKNKEVRHKLFKRSQQGKKKSEKKERRARQNEGIKSENTQHTIESMREEDQTVIDQLNEEDQEEFQKELATDEFSNHYAKIYEPKVLITYGENPHTKTRRFGKELSRMIPNSFVKPRQRSSVKKMCAGAILEGFTDIIIINENRREPNGIVVVHLPGGPTAHFKLSSVKLTSDIKRDFREITTHRPEVILTNFSTRLGITIGRMLGALFHYDPQFKGRRVATFHNQRDYIFFRHHRYEFGKNGEKVKLRELGPRFTLKLRSVQHGLFDTKTGDYEWLITNKRHQLESNRRRFYL